MNVHFAQLIKLIYKLKLQIMKTLLISLAILLGTSSTNLLKAQTAVKSETIKVWGNCGSCKKHIEKAAKAAGATTAIWDEDSKDLKLSYNTKKTSSDKIQQAIAIVGYDTQDFKGNDAAYLKLDKCCQYDRKEDTAAVPIKQ